MKIVMFFLVFAFSANTMAERSEARKIWSDGGECAYDYMIIAITNKGEVWANKEIVGVSGIPSAIEYAKKLKNVVCVMVLADAGIDTTICMGTSFTLGGTPTGAAGNGGPYTYMWSPTTGLSNPTDPNPIYTPSGLGTVTFTVQVDDGSGCPPGIATIDVTTASCCAAVIDSINTTDASCYNTCDGSITISASNTIQYSIDGINWTPNNTFNNLCPGNYTAYVSDGSCPYSTPFVINSPTAITIPNVVTNVTCNGGNDLSLIHI